MVSLKSARRLDIFGLAGCLGLLAFAASALSTQVLHRYLLVFCVCAVVASREARNALWGDPVFRFALVFGAYLLGQTAWGIFLFPETLEVQVQDFGKWVSLFGFLFIGWVIRGDIRRLYGVWALTAVSQWVGMLRVADWRKVMAFRTGEQTGFVMGAGVSGLISATILLGLLVCSGRILGKFNRSWEFCLRFAGLVAGIYLTVYILVASQSRTAWLALAVVLGFQCVKFFWTQGFSLARFSSLSIIPVFAVAVLICGIVINTDLIIARMGPDKQVMANLLHGEVSLGASEHVPVSSFGPRYHVQKFGLEKWLERPLTGWGTGSTQPLIETSHRPELFMQHRGVWMPNFHNAYLEILVRFGLTGALVLLVGAWILVRKAFHARVRAGLPDQFFRFLCGGVSILAIFALTNSCVPYEIWRSYWLIMMGSFYTFALHPFTGSGSVTDFRHV